MAAFYKNFLKGKIGPQTIAVEAELVEAVIKNPTVSKVPGSSDFIEGVFIYQSQIIPLFDISSLVPQAEGPLPSYCLVCKKGEELKGIRVHKVIGIEQEPISLVTNSSEKVLFSLVKYVEGVLNQEEAIPILSIASL